MTGVVGAIGGIGGFLLPTLLGAVKQATGYYAPALAALGVIAAAGGLSLRSLQSPTRAGSWRLPSLAGADEF